MRIKNKYEITFRQLVDDTKKRGGIPKELIISVQEGRDIIDEIGTLYRGKVSTSFRVVFVRNNTRDFILEKTLRQGDLTNEQVYNLLNSWYKGEIAVLYDDIPVYIERQKVANETTRDNCWWHFFKRSKDVKD